MALTKVTKGGITNDAVDGDKLKDGSITTAKIGASAVESSEINNGTVTVDDLASSLDISSKTVTLPNTSVTAGMLSGTLDLSSKTLTLPASTVSALKQPVQDNIALLGFKMAVNDGLTVFNLVDGVVDEFHDESGTDEGEGSNDYYCSSNDFYQNISFSPASYSAGFSTTAVTEEDTSEAGNNPAVGVGTAHTFTVPSGMTALNIAAWGAGGGGGGHSPAGGAGDGGGGGYVEGTLAVTGEQALGIFTAEGGELGWTGSGGGAGGLWGNSPTQRSGFNRGGGNDGQTGGYGGGGGGASFVTTQTSMGSQGALFSVPISANIAAGGGGGGNLPSGEARGGAGGGQGGDAGNTTTEQTSSSGASGGGGDHEQGGDNGTGDGREGQSGGSLYGGDGHFCGGVGGGGGGFYGGGGASYGGQTGHLAGGGGSSYHGHPQITSGATYAGARNGSAGQGPGNAMPVMQESAGASTQPGVISLAPNPITGGTPEYAASNVIGEGGGDPSNPTNNGEDGFVLITATAAPVTTSTTIVSNAFTASSEPASSRIVVFQENVGSVTLNTDIIASISRDGSNFTNVTLADSGYVTGSSGQIILTGTATVSGQPSGTSMRWKLALANNQMKIHGVSLQWK